MFKKPKNNTKFKKNKSANRRIRKREDSDDDDDGNDNNNNTLNNDTANQDQSSSLLAQARQDQQRFTTSKTLFQGGRKRPRESTSTTKDISNKSSSRSSSSTGGVLYAYQAAAEHERKPTAQELATRTAEHHPLHMTNTNNTITADSSSLQAQDGIYKGQSQHQPARSKLLAGPMKAPTNVRTTCRFDYQPDICKDYKETGFCGFGDTCIYLHDRGDTLTGWELERKWEEEKKKEKDQAEKEVQAFLAQADRAGAAKGGGGGDKEGFGGWNDDEEEENMKKERADGIPFACFLCRGPFDNPIVTSCGHYFCQGCILQTSTTDKDGTGYTSCPLCQKELHGVFNHPDKLYAKKRRVVGNEGTWEEFANKMQKTG